MFTSICFLVYLTIILTVLEPIETGFSGTHVELPWQQYYQGYLSHWKLPRTGRPERIRLGKGRYRITHKGAEIDCEFPPNTLILSNIIWERADLGSSGNLDAMYKLFGESRGYSVIGRQKGSTLRLYGQSPLDKGLYRCIATALDPLTERTITVFQDVPFFPSFRFGPKENFKFGFGPKPCCSYNSIYKDLHHGPILYKK